MSIIYSCCHGKLSSLRHHKVGVYGEWRGDVVSKLHTKRNRRECRVCLIHGRWHKNSVAAGSLEHIWLGIFWKFAGFAFVSSTSATVLVTLCVVGLLLLGASLRTLVKVVLESKDETWSEEC